MAGSLSTRSDLTHKGVLALVGHTPIVELTKFDTGLCRLFVKLESQNPGASIKDRPARAMIEAAEKSGKLKAGGTIVEATAGNTGLGLALVAAQKGYKTLLVVPDKMAKEKILHLKALGAEVVVTRSDVGKGHADYYQDMAERMAAEIPGAYYINQFGNEANPLSHETTTGPEILEQMGGDVDAVVVGVGSGGTLTGIGRYMKVHSPKTRMILADPVGSILAPLVNTGVIPNEVGSWAVEGIGEDFIPPILDLSLTQKAYSITDAESFKAARDLLELEGILGGSSSGTLLASALQYCREQTKPQRVVTLVCDSGAKYLSKVFNDAWMEQEGLIARERKGRVRDVIARRHAEGSTVTLKSDETLRVAFGRMRGADVSQLPVVDGERVVGLVTESDLLGAILLDPQDPTRGFGRLVKEVMVTRLETLSADAPIEDLLPLFAKDFVAIITEGDRFLGVVTRFDLINHLRLGGAA
jgi:cystathionine beta-synthase